jgi:non-heme chloroperoxidase
MSGTSAPTSTVAADGVRLATYEWGNPAGPALVLVHGFAQCHLCFAPQVESELARDFRIVAYDLRGHGASDKPADARAYQGSEVWAKDLAAVLAAKKFERPVLVGWSMGGRIIRQYLMNYGDAAIAGLNFVASLVIEDPRCRGSAGPKLPAPGQSLAAQIAAAIAFLDGCYGIKPSESAFRVALAYNMLVPAHVRLAISGWSTDPAETVVALKRVRVRTLITQGRKDAVVLPAAAEMTAAAIPGAELSWFDDCGHSPFSEDAPRFNAELARFMARAAASRS